MPRKCGVANLRSEHNYYVYFNQYFKINNFSLSLNLSAVNVCRTCPKLACYDYWMFLNITLTRKIGFRVGQNPTLLRDLHWVTCQIRNKETKKSLTIIL
jgi:hypothetical protein